MLNNETALGQLGQRDAQRELYRARQARKAAQRAKHENPPVWAYGGTKRKGRGK